MTVGELMRELQGRLAPEYGAGEARAMARLVFHHFKGWDATALVIHEADQASDYLVSKVAETLVRLEKGEPVQYVLGEARFYGMDLKVAPGVLIPRPETAELVDLIVKDNPAPDLRVLDVGTGSGAISIALSRNLKFPEITAIDISGDALKIARKNASTLHARINFEEVDIFKYHPEDESFDIIVSNPPYIAESEKVSMDRNVLDFEPSLALFVPDENPLIYYSRIAEVGRKALKPGGRLYFEINPLFAEDLLRMLEKECYQQVEIHKDAYGKVRFASAIKSK